MSERHGCRATLRGSICFHDDNTRRVTLDYAFDFACTDMDAFRELHVTPEGSEAGSNDAKPSIEQHPPKVPR